MFAGLMAFWEDLLGLCVFLRFGPLCLIVVVSLWFSSILSLEPSSNINGSNSESDADSDGAAEASAQIPHANEEE